jgi:hypothetical protein
VGRAFSRGTAHCGWISIADAAWTQWSSNGNVLYFPSGRDGYRCIWAQRLEPAAKRPIGTPIPVYHVHSLGRFLGDGDFRKICVGRDKMIFNMGERTSNIWMAEWKER